MPSRAGMANIVAEELAVPLDTAAKLVDTLIPIEAYDAEHEIPMDDVNAWLDVIRAEEDSRYENEAAEKWRLIY